MFSFLPALVPQAFAQACGDIGADSLNLSECLTLGKNPQLVSEVYPSASVLVNLIVRNAFIVAGIIIFFLILYSGYQFIEKDAKGIEEAKSIMTAAIAGLLIMFVAYWLVRIVSIITGVPIFL